MQEKVSIMCSWFGWENPSLRLHAGCFKFAFLEDSECIQKGLIVILKLTPK